uniref:Uncharacterized protein n=1 Tax=Fagus sylvatica TaxID=28930 RepID=A0A2N9HIM1_FAGSY
MVEIRPKIWRDLTRSGEILPDLARSHQIRSTVEIDAMFGGVAVQIDAMCEGWLCRSTRCVRGGGGDRCVCGGVAVLRRGGVAVLRHGSMEGVAAWQLGRRCGLVAWRFGCRGKGERNERERE